MRHLKSGIAFAWVLLLFGALAGLETRERPARLRILHFNDFHGQVEPVVSRTGEESGGLARLIGLADARREAARAEGVETRLVCAGDLFTGTAFSTLFQGDPEFQVLQKAGLSALTSGNHEWDFGVGTLMRRITGSGIPLLLCNVSAAEPSHTFWKPWMVARVGGFAVGFTGVTTPETPTTTAPGNTEGFAFSDPVPALSALCGENPGHWDFLVVLSHCGFEQDKRIAKEVKGVGLIVGGHDHKVLETPHVENGVPIVQAGDRGRFLGEVEITLSGASAPAVTGRLLPVTSSTGESGEAAALLRPYLEKEEAALGAVIGRLPEALSGDRVLLRTGEAPLGDFVADAMKEASKAEAAFINGGALRAGLPAGGVTGRDLYACLPFFDSLTTVLLTGEQIQALLDRCASMPREDPPGGFLQVSGIEAVYEKGGARSIRIGGAPLDPARAYRVACTQFLLSGGDGLAEFKSGLDARDYGVSLQEILRRELARPDLRIPKAGGRIVRAGD
ncbi:MAG: bifunctional metallophosphatase/5'-nucleotidase [Acidobacteriota bacterium]